MFPENKLWNQKSTHCIHPLPLSMCFYMRECVFRFVKKIQCLFFFFFTRHRHLSRPQADRVCLSVCLSHCSPRGRSLTLEEEQRASFSLSVSLSPFLAASNPSLTVYTGTPFPGPDRVLRRV
jgi:hypothetical protein